MADPVTPCLDPNPVVVSSPPPIAAFTYPTDGQANVAPRRPSRGRPTRHPRATSWWSAPARRLGPGVERGLPATQTSYRWLPCLPAPCATLWTAVNGVWYASAITITARPTEARLISPVNGQAGVSQNPVVSWSTVSGVQGYAVWFSTSYGGANLANSGLLAANQSSYAPPTLPAGQTIYILLLTLHNDNSWTGQAVTISTAGTKAGADSRAGRAAPGLPPPPR